MNLGISCNNGPCKAISFPVSVLPADPCDMHQPSFWLLYRIPARDLTLRQVHEYRVPGNEFLSNLEA